jgi:hypothetical protein
MLPASYCLALLTVSCIATRLLAGEGRAASARPVPLEFWQRR